jgi:hypothetical protein
MAVTSFSKFVSMLPFLALGIIGIMLAPTIARVVKSTVKEVVPKFKGITRMPSAAAPAVVTPAGVSAR